MWLGAGQEGQGSWQELQWPCKATEMSVTSEATNPVPWSILHGDITMSAMQILCKPGQNN